MADSPDPTAVDPRLDAEYRAWAECTGSMLSRHRLDGTFSYVSAGRSAILGWEPAEINNAAKFTPAGGFIGVVVEETDGIVVVRVRDSGQGIAADALPHVFDLFFHADRPPGTMGVRLSLVRSIVELHGGSVAARSEGLGHGSEFVVRLPMLATHANFADLADATERAASMTEPEGTTDPRRVFVVDDDQAVAEGFVMLLESMGHEVYVVHDGIAAVDATTRFDPEIIFIDLSMPGIDGYETARRIRALPDSENRRLVALTGFGLKTVESRMRAAGLDVYVAKPARPEELQRVFARA